VDEKFIRIAKQARFLTLAKLPCKDSQKISSCAGTKIINCPS
jgi:hypothetical protein